MGGMEESVVSSLQKSGLARSVLPVRVPYIAVWPPIAETSPLWALRNDLLTAIKRRVTYRRLVIATQLAGLCVAWIGVILSKGRPLTLVGVGVTLVGAILTFVDKDRLASIDSQIEQLLKEYRAAMIEWLYICLEIGPYAYANTSAAGVTKLDVLSDRRNVLKPGAVDALSGWLRSVSEDGGRPSQHWSILSNNLGELQMIDEVGQRRERHLWLTFDTARIFVLILALVAAIAIPTLGVPDVVMATLATFIIIGARSANDVTLTIFTRPSGSLASAATPSQEALVRRTRGSSVRDLDETALEGLADIPAVIPRSLLKRRTIRLVKMGRTRL
jgi:hypothetical protein